MAERVCEKFNFESMISDERKSCLRKQLSKDAKNKLIDHLVKVHKSLHSRGKGELYHSQQGGGSAADHNKMFRRYLKSVFKKLNDCDSGRISAEEISSKVSFDEFKMSGGLTGTFARPKPKRPPGPPPGALQNGCMDYAPCPVVDATGQKGCRERGQFQPGDTLEGPLDCYSPPYVGGLRAGRTKKSGGLLGVNARSKGSRFQPQPVEPVQPQPVQPRPYLGPKIANGCHKLAPYRNPNGTCQKELKGSLEDPNRSLGMIERAKKGVAMVKSMVTGSPTSPKKTVPRAAKPPMAPSRQNAITKAPAPMPKRQNAITKAPAPMLTRQNAIARPKPKPAKPAWKSHSKPELGF